VQRNSGGLALLNWRGEVHDIKLPQGSVSIQTGVAWLDGHTLVYAMLAPDGAWALYRQTLDGEPQLLVSARQDKRMQLFQGNFVLGKSGR